MAEYPPPQILWLRLLKQCSWLELDAFRSEILIRLALMNGSSPADKGNDLIAFLRAIKQELAARKSQRNSAREKRPGRSLRST